MTIGEINVQFAFQRSPQVYYGHRDVVHGHVFLSFSSTSNPRQELHGPLRLEIALEGVLQTHVDRTNPISTKKSSLFRNVYVLHNDTVKIADGRRKEFFFAANFPEFFEDTTGGRQVDNSNNGQHAERRLLPPTFSRGGQDAWKKASGVAIKYEMRAEAIMGGIDVKINYPVSHPVLVFEQGLPDPDVLNSTTSIKNSWAMPHPIQRRRGLKEAARNFLAEPQKYTLSIRCRGLPKHIFVGQQLAFDVQVQTSIPPADSSLVPEIWLDSCEVTVRSLTRLSRADRVVSKFGWVEDHREITEDHGNVTANIQADVPFSAENDWAKLITTEPLAMTSSSFTVGRISHQHRIRIRMHLRAGDKEIGFSGECNVTSHAARVDDYRHEGEEQEEELPGYE